MNMEFETTIGKVSYSCDGELIRVKTQKKSKQEFSIDLWDRETGKPRIQFGIDDVFLAVADELNAAFPGFIAHKLKKFDAPLEQLMESQMIQLFAAKQRGI